VLSSHHNHWSGAVRTNQQGGPHFFRASGVIAAGVALMIAGATAASAQNYDSISTPEQRRACSPDVYRLCAGEIPSVPKITACLRRKKASLSDACRAAMGE
jgi:hypothetical protein